VYGGQHQLEVEASEAICDALQWADMVRFGLSGTEMVQAAFRAARAATGRTKIIRFEGHYHGWLDNVLIAHLNGEWGAGSEGQLSSHLDDMILLPWNDANAVEQTLNASGHEIAAVIMEPMMINAGAILPRPGYLHQVRRLCDKHGVVLIFDEVLTGFRLALGGAAERFGVSPDLATYGKALASGWPVSALAGTRELMNPLGTGEVNHAGTFNSSVMAMAATNATLRRLRLDPPYEAITEYGMALMEGFEKIGSNHDEQVHVQGLPMAFHVSFGTDDATDFRTLNRLDGSRYEKFTPSLVDHGLWVASRGIWYVFAAHGARELQTTLERFEEALTAWR